MLFLDLPTQSHGGNAYPSFFYLDANLNSGKAIRQEFKKDGYALIGLAHMDDIAGKRRRDFLPPASDSPAGDFARADQFYDFLIMELIPYLADQYQITMERSTFIGHSFGGIFGMYCMYQEDQPFADYLLLSPSIWANRKSIYRSMNGVPPPHQIYVGGWERFNGIRQDCRKYVAFVESEFGSDIVQMKTTGLKGHSSHLKRSLRRYRSSL